MPLTLSAFNPYLCRSRFAFSMSLTLGQYLTDLYVVCRYFT